MRELTVKLRFTKDCLGSIKRYVVKDGKKWPCFFMPRTPDGQIRFEANWWKHSLRFATEVLCRHQRIVGQVHFDVIVNGKTDTNPDHFYKRYIEPRKFVKHEAFREGTVIAVNCVVPDEINDDDFMQLMSIVGRFKGISPFGPREYGFFVVESLERRNYYAGEIDEANAIQRWEFAEDQTNNK